MIRAILTSGSMRSLRENRINRVLPNSDISRATDTGALKCLIVIAEPATILAASDPGRPAIVSGPWLIVQRRRTGARDEMAEFAALLKERRRSLRMLPWLHRLGAFLIMLMLVWPSVADAADDRRVALVIGNANYRHTTKLLNPRNDAEDLARVLRRLNFEVVDGYD